MGLPPSASNMVMLIVLLVTYAAITHGKNRDALLNEEVTLLCVENLESHQVVFVQWTKSNGHVIDSYTKNMDSRVNRTDSMNKTSGTPFEVPPIEMQSTTQTPLSSTTQKGVPSKKEENKDIVKIPALADNTKYSFDRMGSFALTIYGLTEADTDVYTCSYELNDAGNSNSTTKLFVREMPIIKVSVVNGTQTNTSFKVIWDVPDWWRPHVKEFQVHVWNKTHAVDVIRLSKDTSTVVVDTDISPYTRYTISVRGVSDLAITASHNITVKTKEGIPQVTATLYGSTKTNVTITIQWTYSHSNIIRGVFVGFKITVTPSNQKSECNATMMDKNCTNSQCHVGKNERMYTVKGLKPFTEYDISIQVGNNVGFGPKHTVQLTTKPGVPDPPDIVTAKCSSSSSCFILWKPPKCRNGRFYRYTVWYSAYSDCTNELAMVQSDRLPTISHDGKESIILGLTAFTKYCFWVQWENSGNLASVSEMPKRITDTKESSPPRNVKGSRSGNSSAWVKWDAPQILYGSVSSYEIKTIPLNHRNELLSANEKKHVCPRYGRLETRCEISNLRSAGAYKCAVRSNTNSIQYRRPLKVFNSPWSEWSRPFMISSDELVTGKREIDRELPNDGPVIAISLSITIVFVIIAVTLSVGVRRYMTEKKKRSGTFANASYPESVVAESQPMLVMHYQEDDLDAIPIENMTGHVKNNHADSDLKFSQEYDDINTCHYGKITFTSNCSVEPENRDKNRYVNILAYDHSRVVLEGKNNYINANYVDGYQRSNAYIAAQGPLPHTFEDFWRMVWEQGSSIIIMITNLTEKGRLKCNQYWPDQKDSQYGNFTITNLTDHQIIMAHYTIRFFRLHSHKSKKKEDRIIKQFHYTDWPDHGTPAYALPVLDFVCISSQCADEKPVVIHCSAGVGRTGTYIVLDTMIKQIEDRGTVNVRGFLKHIRKQRNFLVQTEEQYIFIHDVLVEYIQSAGYTSVNRENFQKHLEEITSIYPEETGETKLEKYFKLATKHMPQDFERSIAKLNCNEDKNRMDSLIPVDVCRVVIPKKPGVEGTDYINASYLQGFTKTKEFIVTQHPLETTRQDFWKMVWDQNSKLMVMLSPLEPDKGFGEFWLEKNEVMNCESFKVTFTDDNLDKLDYVSREFLLEAASDDYELEPILISTTEWPDSCSPTSSAFELIKTVMRLQKKRPSGPIIVIDRYGGREAAMFCAMYTVYCQLMAGMDIDIYSITKLYHLKRPDVFQSHEDYRFLHSVVVSSIISDPGLKVVSNPIDAINDSLVAHTHFPTRSNTLTRDGSFLRHKTSFNKKSSMRKSETVC